MLNAIGFGAEAAYDLEGPNKADAEAITFGESLWDKYPNGITEDQLYQEILEFVKTHDVHTKHSEANCTLALKDFRNSPSCEGEAP